LAAQIVADPEGCAYGSLFEEGILRVVSNGRMIEAAGLVKSPSEGVVFEFELNRSALVLSGWVRGYPNARVITH
jgi:hypothetical protein